MSQKELGLVQTHQNVVYVILKALDVDIKQKSVGALRYYSAKALVCYCAFMVQNTYSSAQGTHI